MEMNKSIGLVSFCDGHNIFDKFIDVNIIHKSGYFILAPSGSGKTYFVQHQTKKDWIDGDVLWEATNAAPKNIPWWTMGIAITDVVDQRSDIITLQAKKLGLWIIGASNNWLKPDAIVIPDWETHKKYIKNREAQNYDGGATSGDYTQVLKHREWMLNRSKLLKIPLFNEIVTAANYLENL